MTSSDQSSNIPLTQLEAFIAQILSQYPPAQNVDEYRLQPFEMSGSMAVPEHDFFALGAMGGTNFSSALELEQLILRTESSARPDWNRYTFHCTDGETDGSILPGFFSRIEPLGS